MAELTDINYLHSLFRRNGFNLKKGFGQNFLINPEVCPAITECADIADRGVIEIGPGAGVLTRELAKKAKKVVAIELDKKLRPILEETLRGYDNVTVIFDDAMKCDLKKIISEHFGDMPVSVCANLPYYITSPLIMRLLEDKPGIDSITVMVQKEAAERICAEMGTRECGAVTASVRYYSEPSIAFIVERDSFLPPPNVDSAVINLKIRENPNIIVNSESGFFRLIKAAFAMRRKTLLNSLAANLPFGKDHISNALTNCEIDINARAESLTLDKFALLTNELFKED